VAAEFEEGIQRFEMAISQLEMLFQNDAPTLSQGGLSKRYKVQSVKLTTADLMELDGAMREDLSILTNLKVSRATKSADGRTTTLSTFTFICAKWPTFRYA
jgi:hypothetical protein